MTHPENCPDTFPGLLRPAETHRCVKAPGHRMPHQDANGMTWAPMGPAQRVWRRLVRAVRTP